MIRLSSQGRPRLAIIGTGIAGLVCAHRLQRDYDLTVFEAADYIGGHTHTVDVSLGGRDYAIDTGFIVFNELNYPRFTRLLDELDVASHESSMSFSVRCDRTGVEYKGSSLNTLFAQRRNLLRPSFHRMVRDILRFNREAPDLLRHDDDTLTVSAYRDRASYSPRFVEHYLVPLGAAIWSCPPGRFRSFPMRFVVEFLQQHMMLALRGRPTWRVVSSGSRRYVEALTRPFRDRIRLGTPVRNLRRLGSEVLLSTRAGDVESFDHVIVACHSDQALGLLENPTPRERDILGAIPYQANDVVLHTDVSVLPRRRRAWAAWNYHVPARAGGPATITYNMNILQGLRAPETICVTLNETASIDPRRVIARFTYDHPVFTSGRDAAQRRHAELIDCDGLSFCGAYWGYGFHEDGVRSAWAVCDALSKAPVP